MADVATAICTRLAAHAGTAALIGTRVWLSRLPDDPTYPALVVLKISATRTPLMGDDADKVSARVQVSSWAETRAGVYALAEQVRDALQRWGGTAAGVTVVQVFLDNQVEPFEDDIRQWHFPQDFTVWYTE